MSGNLSVFPSLSLSICLPVPSSVCLCACPSGHQIVCPSIHSSAVCLAICHLAICPSVWPSVSLSVCLSGHLSIWPSVCLSGSLSVCLFVCPSVCLSVCSNHSADVLIKWPTTYSQQNSNIFLIFLIHSKNLTNFQDCKAKPKGSYNGHISKKYLLVLAKILSPSSQILLHFPIVNLQWNKFYKFFEELKKIF